jgi:carbon storage regulator
MLVLSRKQNQAIVIDGGVRVTVLSVRGKQVKLGIEAPDDVRVIRSELEQWDDVPYQDIMGDSRSGGGLSDVELSCVAPS